MEKTKGKYDIDGRDAERTTKVIVIDTFIMECDEIANRLDRIMFLKMAYGNSADAQRLIDIERYHISKEFDRIIDIMVERVSNAREIPME